MTSEQLPDNEFPLALRVVTDVFNGRVQDGIHYGLSHVVINWDKVANAPLLDAHERAAVRCAQAIAALEVAGGGGPHTTVIYSAFVQALHPRPSTSS